MSVKEFAEKYANGQCKNEQYGVGRVVGYSSGDNSGHYVVVEFPDGPYWELNDSTTFDVHWVVPNPKWGWKVPIGSIVSLGPPTNYFKPPIIPPAYPHTCKYCHAPARNSKFTFCSNVRCKSWKKIKRTYPASVSKIAPVVHETKINPRTNTTFHIGIWRKGGCIVCGGYTRGRFLWAHDACYNELYSDDKEYIETICNEC